MYMSLLENLALLLSLSVALQVVLAKARPMGLARTGLYGVVFGTLAVLTAMYPVQIPGGGAVDGSLVGIGIAGIFGGPWAAAIAALMGGTSRFLLGGAGTVGALILIAFTAALSTAFYYLARRHRRRSAFPASGCSP